MIDDSEIEQVALRDGRIGPEIAEVSRPFGQLAVEFDDLVGILRNDRPQMDDTTIGGKHIGNPVPRIVTSDRKRPLTLGIDTGIRCADRPSSAGVRSLSESVTRILRVQPEKREACSARSDDRGIDSGQCAIERRHTGFGCATGAVPR